MEQTKIGKKLTVATMGFDSDTLSEIVEENPKGETQILNVLALVTDSKVEVSRLDPTKTNTRFIGQFEFTNLLTGEVGVSAEAFFPAVAESYVAGFKGSSEGAVRVAFTLTVEKDNAKNSAQGYKFGMLALVDKSADADPFKAMRDLLPKPKTAQKALPAGEKPKGGKK